MKGKELNLEEIESSLILCMWIFVCLLLNNKGRGKWMGGRSYDSYPRETLRKWSD